MRTALATLVFAGLAMVPAIGAQKDSRRTSTALELTGCVSSQTDRKEPYTLTDAASGQQFHLTGKKMDSYAGKKVIVEGPRNGVAIRGGLWPSPNVAAQAGAIDPAQASIARQPGGGGDAKAVTAIQEFRVARVRTVEGNCP